DLFPRFSVFELMEPDIWLWHVGICPQRSRVENEICIPGDMSLPAETAGHRYSEQVLRIVGCGNARGGNASRGFGCAVDVIGIHHVDVNPPHPKIQSFDVKQWRERPTGGTYTQCSGRR